jgi:preprotein translocase subunit SecB
MSTEQATIQFKTFLVKESHIVFDKLTNYQIEINLDANGIVNTSSNIFILRLNVYVKDKDDAFHIEISTESVFSFPQDADIEKYKKSYFILNAPAIIFPYIRAYISSLTALSGMATLTLPTLNLTILGESLKENISIIE